MAEREREREFLSPGVGRTNLWLPPGTAKVRCCGNERDRRHSTTALGGRIVQPDPGPAVFGGGRVTASPCDSIAPLMARRERRCSLVHQPWREAHREKGVCRAPSVRLLVRRLSRCWRRRQAARGGQAHRCSSPPCFFSPTDLLCSVTNTHSRAHRPSSRYRRHQKPFKQTSEAVPRACGTAAPARVLNFVARVGSAGFLPGLASLASFASAQSTGYLWSAGANGMQAWHATAPLTTDAIVHRKKRLRLRRIRIRGRGGSDAGEAQVCWRDESARARGP